jgi:hypothetical protein
MRLGVQEEREVTPRTPRRLLGHREPRLAHHLLWTGGAHGGPQHPPRRVERRALHGHQVKRRGVESGRPPLRFGGLPGQRCDPASQHGERGIPLDRWVAERREPSLHSRHLAGLVGRQEQPCRQLDASVSLGGVQQVLKGKRRRIVGLVPVGGPKVQLHDGLWLDATKLTE